MTASIFPWICLQRVGINEEKFTVDLKNGTLFLW